MAGFDGNPWSQGRHFREKVRGITCDQGKRIGSMRMARCRLSAIADFRQNPPRTLPISAGPGSVRLDALRIVLGFGAGGLRVRMDPVVRVLRSGVQGGGERWCAANGEVICIMLGCKCHPSLFGL